MTCKIVMAGLAIVLARPLAKALLRCGDALLRSDERTRDLG